MSSNETKRLKDLKAIFSAYDRDGNGKISSQEFERIILAAMGPNGQLSKTEIENLYRRADKNNDGELDIPELQAAMNENFSEVERKKQLREVYAVLDVSGNGLVSAKELMEISKQFGEKLTPEEVEIMIEEFDADGDGHISFEEFYLMMKSSA